MDIQLVVPNDQAESVRSGIFAFVSNLEAHADASPAFFCFTVMPIDNAWEYCLHFAESHEGEDFLARLPSIFPNGVVRSRIDA